MEIVIIPLAQKKLRQRGIPIEWVEETIRASTQTVSGYGGRTVYQRLYEAAGKKNQLLRVVCESREGKQFVVTAYLTSEIQRYWRT